MKIIVSQDFDRKKVCTVKPVAVHQNVTFVIDLKHNIIVAARRFSSHNASVLMRNILGVNLRYLQRETGIEITVMAICDLFVAINHERFITEPLDQIEARVASKQRIIFEGSLLTKIVGASKEFVTCEIMSLERCLFLSLL